MDDVVEEAGIPYVHVRNLGHGHSDKVEDVRDLGTNKTHARKTNRITGPQKRRTEKLEVYQNEAKILRGLECHRHVINVHHTYVTKREFGIFLEPVASDGDLEEFLTEYVQEAERSSKQSGGSDLRVIMMVAVIEQGFGCLAAGLAFMNQDRYDIKTSNRAIIWSIRKRSSI
jgi:hypothetical protein